jgi:hypothetical protein
MRLWGVVAVVAIVLGSGSAAHAQPRADACQTLCRPYVGLCRNNGAVYRLCWQNLLQSCRLSSSGFPPQPTCTFPCGSDSDCGFGRKCVVQQCIIPPPSLRLTPRTMCKAMCARAVFPLCNSRTTHLGSRRACKSRAMHWCMQSAPDYHCNSGCGTAYEATGDTCFFNDHVEGTCSDGTCYQLIACQSDADCEWTTATGTCVGGQCVPPPPPPPPGPPGPPSGHRGYCTTFENPPCTPCDTQADCGGFDACLSGATCG